MEPCSWPAVMRITGGKARGIQLGTPRGLATRPAADAIREALFSSLGSRVEGCRFADLFAGTGAYGLEAVSRGAKSGKFVEKHSGCIGSLRGNLESVCKSAGVPVDNYHVLTSDVFKPWNFSGSKFDLVFADPPYADIPGIKSRVFKLVEGMLEPGGLFVLEKPADVSISAPGWKLVKQLGKKRGQGPSLDIWQNLNQSVASE